MDTPAIGPSPPWHHVTPEEASNFKAMAPAGPISVIPPPVMGIPKERRGAKANADLLAAGYGTTAPAPPLDITDCAGKACLPNLAGLAWDVTHPLTDDRSDRPSPSCVCYSDLWFYGGGAFVFLIGAWMLFGSRET